MTGSDTARRERLLVRLVCLVPDDEVVDDRVDLFRVVYDSGGGASDLTYLRVSPERIESSCWEIRQMDSGARASSGYL
jgi:hypothetical protein